MIYRNSLNPPPINVDKICRAPSGSHHPSPFSMAMIDIAPGDFRVIHVTWIRMMEIDLCRIVANKNGVTNETGQLGNWAVQTPRLQVTSNS